ncbi:PI-PLC domain-containing protein [Actinomarinicola tropica]|uniref:Uncharacterized protein n=1 Tax=Actinomarinicola tropica TaxID=2789776 RepID=A0A5Q2RFX7_9ACTN|nr:hypothetical protein [Actinomarinicola tropica]QGG95718.1 hypothetical protein GH723_11765 [Actinomarinicola tropica]
MADPWVTVVALLVGLAAGGALLWRHRRDLVGGSQLLGGALVAAGLLTAGLWWILGRRIDEPLDRATGTGPGTWDLPVGIGDLLADVQSELGSALRQEVLWRAAVPLVAGLALIVVPALPRLARRLPALARRVPAVGSRPLVGGAVAVAIVLGAGLVVGAPTEADPERACNGHVELCDRPYDEVVQPATHNSMSSPDVVEIWPEHDGDIAAQLDAGIRALLIDTHHWTAMVSADDLQRRAPGTSDAVADALWPLVRPFAEERPGTFLCHNHCAFGGMPFVDALDDVRAFLDANPDDVVTLVIQDAISVEETEAAFAEARLESYLYEPSGAGWPTLGEMIDDGERLVVVAEVEGPPPAWYLHAFDEMQETPFTVLRPDAFTCEPNRGPDDASLFLLNHWVQRVAPDRADALEVNAHDVLVDRARRCAAERGQLPDFLAVNFYSLGDVVGAADTLNGVG